MADRSLLWDVTEAQNATMPPVYLSNVSAWHGHIPFAFWITQVQQPWRFVELGVHLGDSYMAFCRGLAALPLRGSVAYGVDTFEGDTQTGPYSDKVYTSLKEVHDPLYREFSTLIRSTFDETAAKFGDGRFDLLHIDGLHTEEAVRHDVLTWLPKLSNRGILLLHDTLSVNPEFGVWRVLNDLRRDYPVFEFFHSNGLAMVLIGSEQPQLLFDLAEQDRTQEGEWVRSYFRLLAERIAMHRKARNA
jgi:hypothetical protein